MGKKRINGERSVNLESLLCRGREVYLKLSIDTPNKCFVGTSGQQLQRFSLVAHYRVNLGVEMKHGRRVVVNEVVVLKKCKFESIEYNKQVPQFAIRKHITYRRKHNRILN